jgi:hypothetical protein
VSRDFSCSQQWTKEGDAFIIGSDIKRLESETLPKFFRHNRFQSLVRQLNFYSFRKINRERNIWVYKHELFHRDHPENLFLVRRRTCPGLDGRKQRFSQPQTSEARDQEDDDADDSSSIESTASPVESSESPAIMRSKRVFQESGLATPLTQSSKRVSTGSFNSSGAARVDTSMVQPSNEISETEDTDDHTNASKAERMSVTEQSMIVSVVAMKLEEYARKAMKGRSSCKNRRSGVVTPPTVSTSSLFTYDDEPDLDPHEDRLLSSLRTTPPATTSSAKSGPPIAPTRTLFDREPELSAPLMDNQTALSMTNDMVLNSPEHLRSSLIAPTAVACFCLSTSPVGDKNLCTKILHFVSSCDKLCDEFQHYLSALHPVDPVENQGPVKVLHDVWEREASREDAVREFKTFAVNCLQKLLAFEPADSSNQKALERTARVWRESISCNA